MPFNAVGTQLNRYVSLCGQADCVSHRLPRNYPDVVANLANLADCIRIMPTSGPAFTAQAPLFPVFLLGLLATVPKHKSIAESWFERVTQTPVRSVRDLALALCESYLSYTNAITRAFHRSMTCFVECGPGSIRKQRPLHHTTPSCLGSSAIGARGGSVSWRK